MKKILISLLFSFSLINCFSQENNHKKINIDYWKLSDNKSINIDSCKSYLNDIFELLHNKDIIPDPFKNDNETKLGWIDSTSWTYSSLFNLTTEDISNENIILKCRNINTYSNIYINNVSISQTNNEFLEYRFNIKPYIHKGENSIKVVIEPAYKKLNYLSENYNTLESEKRVISRKAQYRYGWDWFPKMLSVGFNNIFIEIYNKEPQFEFANIQTKEIKKDSSLMLLNVGFSNISNGNYIIKLSDFKYSNKFSYSKEPNYTSIKTKEYVFYFSKNDLDTSNLFKTEFAIPSPKLWYPNGFNEKQYLYNATIELIDNNKREAKTLNKQRINFGIRTIELIQEKDSIGQSFYFKINGKPLFIKGANYIATESQYINSLDAAVNANMNMLRVWGGSRYLSDGFLRTCDELGILVWQDFPFACALYPGDSNFLDNVRKEAEQNVKRIAGHPSLALWCGNNEIWEGWNNWGWKQEVKDTIKAVENYNKLFKELLTDIVNKYCPTINYIHTSPLYGWGRRESLTHGDCHYWGVWWADSTFETYTRKVPRFMSEYGFQSTPNLETTQEYMSLPYSKENPEFAIHQKHPRGFELIDNRIKEYFDSYTSDKDYIYKSQAVQQEACKIAIEAHRRAKPYCMGTLFWQLNEEYPAIGWGIIDYKYGYKSAYYVIKKAYEPIILSIDNFSNKDSVFIYYCNDIDSNYSMDFKATIYDNNGIMHYSKDIKKLDIKNNKSEKILSICLSNIKGFNPKTDYLYVEGIINNKTIDNHSFFVKPKDYIKPLNSNNIFSIKDSNFKDISKKESFIESKEVLRNVVIGITSLGVDWLVPEGVCIIDILPNKKNNQFEYQQVESILK